MTTTNRAEFNENGATFINTVNYDDYENPEASFTGESSTNIEGGTVTISSTARDDGKNIVINGHTGTMSGLSNTTWTDEIAQAAADKTSEAASVAATQGQLQDLSGELSQLDDRAVKYDLTMTEDGTTVVDYGKVTLGGTTYDQETDEGGTHLTNVAYATGNDRSEAVNVGYLEDTATELIAGANNLSVEGEVTEQHKNGGNWTITDNKGTETTEDDVTFTNTTLDTANSGAITGTEVQSNDGKTTYGQDYAIKDTDGNTVTLEDIADANTLKAVDNKISDLQYNSIVQGDSDETSIVQNGDNVTVAIGKLDNQVYTNTTNISTLQSQTIDGGYVEDGTINLTHKNDDNTATTIASIDGLEDYTLQDGQFITKEFDSNGKATGATILTLVDRYDPTKTEKVTIDGLVTYNTTQQLDETTGETVVTGIDYENIRLAGETGTRITNLKDGWVNENSTDAVNGSQLYSVQQEAEKHTTMTVNGGTAAPTIPEGQTTSTYTDGNLQLKQTDNDGQIEYDVKLNDDITLDANANDGNSVALSGTNGTISAENRDMRFIGSPNDPITVGTINEFDFNGNGATFSKTTFESGIVQKEETSSTNIDGGTVTISSTARNDGKDIVISGDNGTMSGLSNTTWDTELAAQNGYANSDKAATEAQIQSAVNNISENSYKGWTVSTNGGTENGGKQAAVISNGTVDFSNEDNNIVIGQDGTDLTFDLNDNITLGTGTNQISINGDPTGDEPAISVGDRFVVGHDGTIQSTVTSGLFGSTTTSFDFDANGITVKKNQSGRNSSTNINGGSITVSDAEYGNTVINGSRITAGDIRINSTTGGANTIIGLSNTTWDDTVKDAVAASVEGDNKTEASKAATQAQLLAATDELSDNIGELDDFAVKYDKNNDGTPNYSSVTLAGENGTTITNLAAGVNDSDAVNVAQLKDVEALASKHTTMTVNNEEIQAPSGENEGNYTDGNLQLKQTVTDGQIEYNVKLNDNIYLGGSQTEEDSNIALNGSTGNIKAVVSATEGTETVTNILEFNEDGLTYTKNIPNIDGTETTSSTNINGGRITASLDGFGSTNISGSIISANNYTVNDEGEVEGTSIRINGNSGTITMDSSDRKDGKSIRIDANTGEMSGLSNTSWTPEIANAAADKTSEAASVAATQGQLKDVADIAEDAAMEAAKHTTVKLADDEENITLTQDINEDGGIEYTVGLSKDLVVDSVTAGNSVMNTTGFTTGNIKVDGTTNHITGLANTEWTTEIANAVKANKNGEAGYAATQGQLSAIADWTEEQISNSGWTVSTNGKETTDIKNGDTVDFSNTDGNIVISQEEVIDEDGNIISTDIKFDLADKVNIGDNVVIDGTTGNATFGGENAFVDILGSSGTINLSGSTYNIVIGGDNGTISGLTNTTWNSANDYSQSTQAATEAQLQQAVNDAKTDMSNSDKALVSGAGKTGQLGVYNEVTENGDVNLRVENASGEGYDVTIKDVASASDLGDVTNINEDLKNEDGSHTTVVDAVNNLDDKVGSGDFTGSTHITNPGDTTITDAIKDLDSAITDVTTSASVNRTEVTGSDNITVTDNGTADKHNYQVSLNDDITLGSTNGNNVQLGGTNGTISATGNVSAGSFTSGDITINSGSSGLVSGLHNTEWNWSKYDEGGYSSSSNAATEAQLSSAMEGAVQYDRVTDENGNITIDKTNITLNKGGDSVTIHNVAGGRVEQGSTDAVNGDQLYQVQQGVNNNANAINNMNNRVSSLSNRIDKVGAGAAALAALHPLDFDPDDKLSFAAGYGNYAGENAVAVGAFYQPNEDTMFSIGGTFGNDENMVNAGVSFKLGQKNNVSRSRVSMAKELVALRDEVAQLKALMAHSGVLPANGQFDTSDLFPDIPENHWAYEYVHELAKLGIVEGYPDGNFDGDRMMTRYEFAAMVYRAMQKGVNVDKRMLTEFEPELKLIRVDAVAKDRNGNPTIERVRVNEEATQQA